MSGAPYRALRVRPAGLYQLPIVRHALGLYHRFWWGEPGGGRTTGSRRGGPFVSMVWPSRCGGRTRCPNVGGGGAGDSNATTCRPERGAAFLPLPGRLLPQLEGARPRPRPQGRPLGGVRAPPYSPSRGRGWEGTFCGSLGSCGSDCPSLCCLTASRNPRG